MFRRLLLLFTIVPAVELILLVQVGQRVGVWPTIALIVGTAVLGAYLSKREGLAVWKRFNEKVQAGGLPGSELLDGVIVLVAAALLLTPGVLTDVVGVLGLLPPSRALIRREVAKRLKGRVVQVHPFQHGFEQPADPDDISEHASYTVYPNSSRETGTKNGDTERG